MHLVLYRDIEDGVMGLESVDSGFYDRENKRGMLYASDAILYINNICECEFEELLTMIFTDGKLNLVGSGYNVKYEYDDGCGEEESNEN